MLRSWESATIMFQRSAIRTFLLVLVVLVVVVSATFYSSPTSEKSPRPFHHNDDSTSTSISPSSMQYHISISSRSSSSSSSTILIFTKILVNFSTALEIRSHEKEKSSLSSQEIKPWWWIPHEGISFNFLLVDNDDGWFSVGRLTLKLSCY